MVSMGWHRGIYEFAGRLTQPLQAIDSLPGLSVSAAPHPDGEVVGFYETYRFAEDPILRQPLRGCEMSI